MGRTYSPGWILAAIVASAIVVLAAPIVGQLTAWLRDAARENYVLVLGLLVGSAAIAALLSALFIIRERRIERFGWIVAALAIAAGYAFITRSGVAESDAAERFHFVEYGAIAFLFYKAWRPSGDGSALLLPLLAGVLVGTCEEWLQWFVPGRVGEAKDVLLNLFAVSAGVLFAIGLDPPSALTLSLSRVSRRRVIMLGSATFVVFAGFFHSVHLGYEIADRDAGVFRSRYSAERLLELSRARAERWKVDPPLTWSRYSQEDQYLTEGVAHVRRRNQRWDEGHLLAARHENLILEKYYQPVLDTPSYISATGHRWPAEQRASVEQVSGPGFMIYVSDALDYPVVTWPPWLYWLLVATVLVLTLRRTL